jgi:dissimilatory sulfite reductase (desulfoviridin) alpha/beta subunit
MPRGRVRVPGGHLTARYLRVVQEIAERYGNGDVHVTILQGFGIPGIPFNKVPEVNRAPASLMESLEQGIGVSLEAIDEVSYCSAASCESFRLWPTKSANRTI